MTVTTHCCRCGDLYDLEFDPYDITEGGAVTTHRVDKEMFKRRDFARCPNGHRDPAAFVVGAIADHLQEIHWDWEAEEQHRAESPRCFIESSEEDVETAWAGGPPSESCTSDGGEPVHQPAHLSRGGGVEQKALMDKERPCPNLKGAA